MPREAGMFAWPEHAIAVAYLMLAMPIEPKNPTQLVCEALRERFDVGVRVQGSVRAGAACVACAGRAHRQADGAETRRPRVLSHLACTVWNR